jgi:L,D-peptidoglycan transpeptidase YkuD (ErfK/YbiS/YcfS/YnhG family)
MMLLREPHLQLYEFPLQVRSPKLGQQTLNAPMEMPIINFHVSSNGWIDLPGHGSRTRAALGRTGVVAGEKKREGDGATPLGDYAMRQVLYRSDRVAIPQTQLPVRAILADDGWCDAPGDPAYNRLVRRPYPASCETLFREDSLYDIILVLGHNDNPPVVGRGSAIFLHCKRGDYEPTEGCIALATDAVLALLALASPGDGITID